MPTFLPFKALLPHPDFVQHTILETDLIFDSESERIERGFNPYSFWPVLRPVGYRPDQVAEFESALEASHKRLQQLMGDGIFQVDEEECFYVYQVDTGVIVQTGLVGLVSAQDLQDQKIKKHEKTREDRELQLSRFLEEIGINTTPVNLTYQHQHELDVLLAEITKESPPFLEATGSQNYVYKIWRVKQPDWVDEIMQAFHRCPSFYIADGHHRAACASHSFFEKKSSALEYFTATLISSSQLNIHPFYRLIKKHDEFNREELLQKLNKEFVVKEVLLDQWYFQFLSSYHFLLCFADKTYLLVPREHWEFNSVLERLDVSVLQSKIIDPILGIREITKDPRIAFGTKSMPLKKFKALLSEVDTACVLLCRAPEIDDIFEVSDLGQVMPPKSTSFEPKILSGLVMQIL
ncbi:MAG: hypothetical protein RLY64_324 [Bacteroidota bacterium]|jgi:uncharacterized protein (DUF1015 family)